MSYGKLVRDGIPDKIRRNGEEPIFSFLSYEQLMPNLGHKLVEEAWEVFDVRLEESFIDELADFQEVLDSIQRLNDSDFNAILSIADKLAKEGTAEALPYDLQLSLYKNALVNASNGVLDSILNDKDWHINLAKSYKAKDDLMRFVDCSTDSLEQAQLAKRERLGGFLMGVYLKGVN